MSFKSWSLAILRVLRPNSQAPAKPASASASNACDVIEIENLQGRYIHLLNSNRLDLVVSFFAQHDKDVTLDLPAMHGNPVTGLRAIAQEFANLQTMITAQGGFMGTHLVTTPVVRIGKDCLTAEGSWMSFGFTVLGPAFGNPTPPYPTTPVIGRYAHDFVKESGAWKFKHFQWSKFACLPSFQFDLKAGSGSGPGWANELLGAGHKRNPWPLDPVDAVIVKD